MKPLVTSAHEHICICIFLTRSKYSIIHVIHITIVCISLFVSSFVYLMEQAHLEVSGGYTVVINHF